MPRYVAFLRGVNLGAHRRITNEDLRRRFEQFGLREASTFRASGNVIFQSDVRSESRLQAQIEAGLAEALGYEVTTFIRSEHEVRAIAASQPFAQAGPGGGKLQVALLAKPPSAEARNSVETLSSRHDRLGFGARELFWLPAGRMSDSTLDLKQIERLLGPMTIRTMGTIEQIAATRLGR